MNFKEWLNVDEARFKGFKRMFQAQHPDMPRYVQNDLYNSRVGSGLGRSVNAKSNPPSTVRPASSWPALSPEQEEERRKRWASMTPTQILDRSGFGTDRWGKKAEVLIGRSGKGVTPADFIEKTQWYFLDRRFGYREEPQIRNDAERTNTQKQLLDKNPGKNEPVIVRKTPQGYELIEGWHRTMNLLLKGAPPEQLQALQTGYVSDIQFHQWQPVSITAFIANGNEGGVDADGTGDYIPSDSNATGDYVYQSSSYN